MNCTRDYTLVRLVKGKNTDYAKFPDCYLYHQNYKLCNVYLGSYILQIEQVACAHVLHNIIAQTVIKFRQIKANTMMLSVLCDFRHTHIFYKIKTLYISNLDY